MKKIFAFTLVIALAAAGWFYGLTPADAAGEVPHITSASYAAEVDQAGVPVMIMFDATWCPYCRKMQPLVQKLNDAGANGMKIVRIDMDDEPELAAQFEVALLPTFVVLKNGQPVDRHDGSMKEEALFTFAREAAEKASIVP